MTTRAGSTLSVEVDREAVAVAPRLLGLGGRFSVELGIGIDAGAAERWCVAATRFGTRISASVTGRTFPVLDAAGLKRVVQAGHRQRDAPVGLLDQGVANPGETLRTVARPLPIAGDRGVLVGAVSVRDLLRLLLLDALDGRSS